MVLVVSAAGAVSGRCGWGWEADDGAGCVPGFVGVSAMP